MAEQDDPTRRLDPATNWLGHLTPAELRGPGVPASDLPGTGVPGSVGRTSPGFTLEFPGFTVPGVTGFGGGQTGPFGPSGGGGMPDWLQALGWAEKGLQALNQVGSLFGDTPGLEPGPVTTTPAADPGFPELTG